MYRYITHKNTHTHTAGLHLHQYPGHRHITHTLIHPRHYHRGHTDFLTRPNMRCLARNSTQLASCVRRPVWFEAWSVWLRVQQCAIFRPGEFIIFLGFRLGELLGWRYCAYFCVDVMVVRALLIFGIVALVLAPLVFLFGCVLVCTWVHAYMHTCAHRHISTWSHKAQT